MEEVRARLQSAHPSVREAGCGQETLPSGVTQSALRWTGSVFNSAFFPTVLKAQLIREWETRCLGDVFLLNFHLHLKLSTSLKTTLKISGTTSSLSLESAPSTQEVSLVHLTTWQLRGGHAGASEKEDEDIPEVETRNDKRQRKECDLWSWAAGVLAQAGPSGSFKKGRFIGATWPHTEFTVCAPAQTCVHSYVHTCTCTHACV